MDSIKKDRDEKGKFLKGNKVGFKEGDPRPIGAGYKEREWNPEDLHKKLKEYFELRGKKKKPPTISGLIYCLDISKSTFYNYKKDPKYKYIIERFLLLIEDYLEQYGYTGKATAWVIFKLKNHFGWKDDRNLRVAGIANEPPLVQLVTKHGDFDKKVAGEIESDSSNG